MIVMATTHDNKKHRAHEYDKRTGDELIKASNSVNTRWRCGTSCHGFLIPPTIRIFLEHDFMTAWNPVLSASCMRLCKSLILRASYWSHRLQQISMIRVLNEIEAWPLERLRLSLTRLNECHYKDSFIANLVLAADTSYAMNLLLTPQV